MDPHCQMYHNRQGNGKNGTDKCLTKRGSNVKINYFFHCNAVFHL